MVQICHINYQYVNVNVTISHNSTALIVSAERLLKIFKITSEISKIACWISETV